jgi:uridine phosphorylase
MPKQPHLQVDVGDVQRVAFLPGDPGRVDRIADHLGYSVEVAHNREFKVVNGGYEGTPVTVCSTGIGSPSAAIVVEELARAGVETFIRVGTTGALQSHFENGDLIVPTAAAKDEGTTERYESDAYPAVADHGVVSAIRDAAADRDETVHTGAVATDDAFYAETTEYVEDWEAAGLLSVEMEAAALFTLARRRRLRAGAILTVDGNLVADEQKGEGGDELPEETQENIDRAIDVALEAGVSLVRD